MNSVPSQDQSTYIVRRVFAGEAEPRNRHCLPRKLCCDKAVSTNPREKSAIACKGQPQSLLGTTVECR